MADEIDDVNGSSSGQNEDDLESQAQGDPGEGEPGGEGGAEQKIPYSRFKQVNERAKSAEQVVNYYRQHVGDNPEDIAAFKQWKAENLKAANQAKQEGKISKEKLDSIRDLMRQADPVYAQFVEQQEAEKQERVAAQFDDAEDIVREFGVKEVGISAKDEDALIFFGVNVMEAIKNDQKLLRKWHSGNAGAAVKAACKVVQDKYISVIRKNGKPPSLDTKRQVRDLPTFPRGGSAATSSKAPARKEDDRGITKKAHDDAWEILQARMQE